MKVTDATGVKRNSTLANLARLFLVVIVALAIHPSLAGQTTYPGLIGVNIRDRPTSFVDTFKDRGRLFHDRSGNLVPTDANGWPTTDGIATVFDNRPVPAWTSTIDDPEQYQPDSSGTYVVSFHGQATLSSVSGAPALNFSHQTYDPLTNTTTVDVTMPGGPTYADGPALMEISFVNTRRIPTSDTNTGITNLQVLRPDMPALAYGQAFGQAGLNPDGQIFDPTFLKALAPFGFLRFMQWTNTDFNPGSYGDKGHHLITWADRSLPTDVYQGMGTSIRTGAEGISWEYVILLANATNKDIWINIPISATGGSDVLDPTYDTSADSYVYQLALLLKNGDAFTDNKGLNPGLHIYVEHSNEVWNQGFLQATWNKLAAEDEVSKGGSTLDDDGDTNPSDWAARRHIKRLYEIAQIFQKVFGPDSLNTRIRPVYAWQQVQEGAGSSAANALAWFNKTYGAPNSYFYAFAQGDYFTAKNYANDTTIPDVLSDMQAFSNGRVTYVRQAKATANLYHLQLFAYEGGPDNSNGGTRGTTNIGVQIEANRAPEMGTLVQNHIRSNWFDQGGNSFAFYELSDAYSRYGSYGATDDYRNLTTAKYNALLDLLGFTARGVPSSPENLAAAAGNQQVLLSWKAMPGATGYQVRRRLAYEGPYTTLGSVSSSTFADFHVTNGTTYYYVVTAVNGRRKSPASNEVSATPEAVFPTAPASLMATPSEGQVRLAWASVPGVGAVSYDLYEGASPGGEGMVPVATGITTTSYTVTGLVDGTAYYFEVAAVNSVGTGPVSGEAGATPEPLLLIAQTNLNTATITSSRRDVAKGGVGAFSTEATATTDLSDPSGLLAYEPFGEATGNLNGASGDGSTGFGSHAWAIGKGGTAMSDDSYNVATTVPLSYINLLTTGGYATSAGANGDAAGRYFDTSSTGPFSAYLEANGTTGDGETVGPMIGAPGTTLWISALARIDSFVNSDYYGIYLSNEHWQSWGYWSSSAAMGYFKSLSQGSDGTPYWSLSVQDGTVYRSAVPVVAGQPALLILEVTFGASGQNSTINFYVNPTSLGGASPATPDAQYSTANNLNFDSLALFSGEDWQKIGPAPASFTDIRVGTSYAAVTPVSSGPAAPTNLTAMAGSAQASLSWTASPGATSYNVYEGTASGGENSIAVASGVSSTSYPVTGLADGKEYYFTVKAVNSSGISPASNEATATPAAPVLSAPIGLTAAAGSGQVTLVWQAVSGAEYYNVYEGTASGGESPSPVVIPGHGVIGTTSYTVTGLTNGTPYYFEVAAVNPAGAGTVSNEANATPSADNAIPAAPAGLSAVSGDMHVTLSWSAVPGAKTYNLYEGIASGGESTTPLVTGITTLSYAMTGLSNGGAYYFEVAATNSFGTSGKSNEAAGTPAAAVEGANIVPADFSIYPEVIAAAPMKTGFNMTPSANKVNGDVVENAWLKDGGFAPYDERLSLVATQDGDSGGTTFISIPSSITGSSTANGGTPWWNSIVSGYFVGATAYTYRFSSGAWSLLRTDTVKSYTAVLGSASPSDYTITFENSGPQTLAGDIIWLDMDDVAAIPSIQYLASRFTNYSPTWSTETQNSETRGVTYPASLSTDVPSSDAGGLSMEISDTNTETQGIWQHFRHAFVEPYYEEFIQGDTYEVDVWLKQSGIGDGSVTFSLKGFNISHTFTGVTDTWQHFIWTFPAVPGLNAGSTPPTVHLDFNAPGTMWVDNFQLYDTAWPPNTVYTPVMQAWKDYSPGTVRIWSNYFSASPNYRFYSLDSWLTPEIKIRNIPAIGAGAEEDGELEHLPDALANVKTIGAGANPWLNVNMSLSAQEWGELIDYLAAPAGTGYASKRPADHPGPYTDDFDMIYMEVGNEQWANQVPADTEYGQWAHYVITQALAGKSYSGLSKIKFIVNGFTENIGAGFGPAAAKAAPEASYVDYFLYGNGQEGLSGDALYQSDLIEVPSTRGPSIDAIVERQQEDAANGVNYGLAAYEEGPGGDAGATTGSPGDNSLAAAIGAIDINLDASLHGFGPQNFYGFDLDTYGLGGNFSSHTTFGNGFRPHPVWEAYQMRNNYCNGPMMWTTTNSVPTSTDGYAYPLIAVYAFEDANVANQADVVVISRDLNNVTPVTLHFPATPTGTAQLYTLTGDPRADNNSSMLAPIDSQQVSVTANYTFDMPPGSMYIFQVPMNSTWSSSGEPAPATPVSLSAVAGNTKVKLMWASSDGATSYDVLRGTTSGGPYTQIATSTTLFYSDISVTDGTTYYYVVKATNSAGASGDSPEASALPNVVDSGEVSSQPPLDGSDTGVWANVSPIALAHDFNTFTPDTSWYKTLWDSNYLYLLVSVQDSTLTAPTQANVFDGDAVEVYFSGTDTQNTTYGPTDFQYAFPYGSGGAAVTESKHNAVTGVVLGPQSITGGYQMAIAIPWTTLGTTPVAGQQYGFDVMVDDATSQGDRVGKLAWWATADQTWSNPSLMGPLMLTAQ